jgi:aryl-alcohol dehydrogenase-like predicted oxidoreductase
MCRDWSARIPGTRKLTRREENIDVVSVDLTADDV